MYSRQFWKFPRQPPSGRPLSPKRPGRSGRYLTKKWTQSHFLYDQIRERTLAILELIANSENGITLQEIAQAMDMAKSSAYSCGKGSEKKRIVSGRKYTQRGFDGVCAHGGVPAVKRTVQSFRPGHYSPHQSGVGGGGFVFQPAKQLGDSRGNRPFHRSRNPYCRILWRRRL